MSLVATLICNPNNPALDSTILDGARAVLPTAGPARWLWDEVAADIQSLVRERLGAHAYPRRIEFVSDLPKTLTGKIRRIELRQLEVERASAGTRA